MPELERMVERGAGALQSPTSTGALPPDESAKHALSPSRLAVLEQLRQRAGESVSLGTLADLFRLTCCACGMEDLPTYCSGCPMLDLVNRVLAGSARASTGSSGDLRVARR